MLYAPSRNTLKFVLLVLSGFCIHGAAEACESEDFKSAICMSQQLYMYLRYVFYFCAACWMGVVPGTR
jgi:hypothetical protein